MVTRLKNTELYDMYNKYMEGIDLYTDYIEDYNQMEKARRTNDLVRNKIADILEDLNSRDVKVCEMYIGDISNKGSMPTIYDLKVGGKTSTDAIPLFIFNSDLYKGEELRDKGYKVIRDTDGNVVWKY